jgi:hypothetical protein
MAGLQDDAFPGSISSILVPIQRNSANGRQEGCKVSDQRGEGRLTDRTFFNLSSSAFALEGSSFAESKTDFSAGIISSALTTH